MNEVRLPTLRPVAITTDGSSEDKRPAPKARAKKRRRWVWPVGIAALLVLGLVVVQRGRAKAAPVDPSLLVTVTRKPLEVEIFETGRIQPREKADVKSRVAGQVAKVFVQEGASVKEGDVLLTLDPTDYQRDLARTEADVASASAALDFAKLTHQRAERGAAQGIAPQFDVQQTAHDERTRLVALRAAEVARNMAQDRLNYTKVLAPMDGTVIVRGIEPGESVVPGVQATMDGKPLLTIADLRTLLVKLNLNQIDVAKVAVGRKATLTLDALPGHSYTATLTKVAPASVKLTGKDQEVFPVEAQIDAPDGLVKPGMTADVRVHLDSKPGVLVVPLEAIVKENGRSYVMKVVDVKPGEQRTDKVEVQPGLRNEREVEITGVDEGARVMLKPPSAAENEMKL